MLFCLTGVFTLVLHLLKKHEVRQRLIHHLGTQLKHMFVVYTTTMLIDVRTVTCCEILCEIS
jgi:hypothetical protein